MQKQKALDRKWKYSIPKILLQMSDDWFWQSIWNVLPVKLEFPIPVMQKHDYSSYNQDNKNLHLLLRRVTSTG